jgi:ribonuclease E
MSTAPRKRRRRGGRGRGRKPAQTADATPETTDPDGAPAETPKPRAPRARKEATAGAEGEAAEPKPAPKPRPPRSRTAAAREPAEGQAPTSTTTPPEGETVEVADGATPPRKRRRRGGRGRGKKKTAQPVEGEETSSSDARPPAAPRARRAAASQPRDESQVSTRLRRARQTRQTRSTSRRRREPLPVVPRVTDKLMAITEHGERDQIAVLEGRDLVQHYVTRIGAHSMVGNVYLGRVQNVLPGMEAAFIDVGRGRNAVLYAGEVNYSPEDLEGSPPRIEKVLKNGQSVLVQVTKDPIGGKGARLTAQISMPGRYLVLVPSSTVTGISRRLGEEERKRLKAIYKKIKPDPHGLIVRTAAEGASEEALAADLGRLLEEWTAIEKRAKKAKAPAVLYEEPELTVRVVRDLFTDEEYRELVTDSPRVYEIVTDYLRQADPEVVGKVRLHEGRLPVFEEFHIVEQIHKGLDRKVWLPSGGYIVIDRTEALTVIDVNTGKSVGKTNLEETVVNTNLEAAREVARQLRLRDIGGMIVIDMIDMLLEQNKKKVIETLRESLAQDKSRSQVFDISPLGLLEVTRKRVSGGLLESFSETCPTCEGRGVLLTYDVN